MRESNSHQRFWRPLSYHLTNPLCFVSVAIIHTKGTVVKAKLTKICMEMTKFYEWSWEYRKQRQLTYTIVTFCKSKRRWRDLNPRTGCPAYRISSADPSATWVHLHGVTNQQIRYSLYFLVFLPSIPVFAAS